MKINILITILIAFTLSNTYAQTSYSSVPIPAKPQQSTIILYGATAHVGNGEVIENSLIELENGKIIRIEAAKGGMPKASGDVVDISGKHVYPGFIALNTTIGLSEVGAVRATRDFAETGGLNPNVRSIIAYNTDSRVTPTIRSNGVMLAQITPQAGLISGQSSVVELDAWNWEDAAYKVDEGIYLSWPSMFTRSGWWAEPGGVKKNKKYDEAKTSIKNLLDQAKGYCNGKESYETKNLKLEAMCGLFDKSKKLYVRVGYVKAMIDVINLLSDYDIEMVIVGGQDAWMITDLLKEKNIPIVLNKTHNLPQRKHDDIDMPFKLPKLLQDAGIDYCITIGSGWDGFWDQRNLAFEAGTAAGYGLTKEEALATITSSPAKILGIDQTVGTLEKGKDATLIISKGDVLDMKSSHIEMAFIRGRQLDLDNKQKQLYRKFMDKYGQEKKQH